MKKRLQNFTAFRVAIALFLAVMALGFTMAESDDWEVPAEYDAMENPMSADEESLDIGKELYSQHCKSCHGKYGEGDGTKAAELETDCGDFTSEEFQAQSDGSLFYKTLEGRDEMPSYKKKIPNDEDLWHLVNYLRSMAE